jgi:hypothetical protein
MTDVKTCANAACSCIPPEKEKYCSAHCEGMEDKVEVLCGCGHGSCQVAHTRTVVTGTAVEYVDERPLGAPVAGGPGVTVVP